MGSRKTTDTFNPSEIDAVLFDVFGTVVDWRASVVQELNNIGQTHNISMDWEAFAHEWRRGYLDGTKKIAASQSSGGQLNVDMMHREILDTLLSTPAFAELGMVLDEEKRRYLNLVWHRLQGWPDAVEGLTKLKKYVMIGSLSNGNVRLLVDMAKCAQLPWDVVLSSEMFGSYKPNPQIYEGALRLLGLGEHPERCALVAAHMWDMHGARRVGMKTVYIPRAGEDTADPKDGMGGEVDLVIASFTELSQMFENN